MRRAMTRGIVYVTSCATLLYNQRTKSPSGALLGFKSCGCLLDKETGSMNIKQIILLVLCVAGTVLPYSHFILFLRDYGFDMNQFIRQLFANNASSFFAFDVIISSMVLWLFVYTEGARLRMRNLWVYVAASLAVGVSLALPLFLLARQLRLDKSTN